MQVPVATLEKGRAFFLDFSEVRFMRKGEGDHTRDLLVATGTRTYRLVRNVQEMGWALEGTDYLRVFQNIVVNMDFATDYDPKRHILYFEPAGAERLESSYVSREMRSEVKSWLGLY